jgi:ATP-binding cassette, subfamily A (ABC1), member 3
MEHKCGTVIQQIWALARKTMLIAVVRHWFATLFRAVLLPIAFMVFLVNIKYLVYPNYGYGVGSPLPVVRLLDAIPTSRKLVFVQPPNTGADVSRVVHEVTSSLLGRRNVIILTNETDVLSTCLESLAGSSDCFAAVVFNDSPMTVGKNGIWDYTIRADSNTGGDGFHVTRHDNDEENIFLPLQVAIDNSIINSTVMPQEYMYTTITQAQDNDNKRKMYQRLIIRIYGIVFFIAFSSQIYHVVGMMTTERASGMAQLIDAMGGTPGIRISSYLISFNIIYAPSWVIFGICKFPISPHLSSRA